LEARARKEEEGTTSRRLTLRKRKIMSCGWRRNWHKSSSQRKGKGTDGTKFWNEPTWRCHQNPFIGALGIINLLSLASHK